MTDYEVIKKIMDSTKIDEQKKIWYIQSFLLHWFKVEDVEWLWID